VIRVMVLRGMCNRRKGSLSQADKAWLSSRIISGPPVRAPLKSTAGAGVLHSILVASKAFFEQTVTYILLRMYICIYL
jgi:hypothetical protein